MSANSCAQDGRFDCPDRMFYDMKQCWSGCIDVNNMSDVKELTPEFFYCPEIFLNSNKLPLGEQQVRGTVDLMNTLLSSPDSLLPRTELFVKSLLKIAHYINS